MSEAEQKPGAWSQFGGVSFFYGLQRQHAKLQLMGAPRTVYTLILSDLKEGPGFWRFRASGGMVDYDGWLFPQNNPKYLTLVELIKFSKDNAVKAICRASPENSNILFLIDLLEIADDWPAEPITL